MQHLIKWNCVIVVLLIFHHTITAQGSLSGKISDNAGAPVSFATVVLLNPSDSSMIKGSISNDAGGFVIDNIPISSYLLKVLAIGYKEVFCNALLSDSLTKLELPVLILHPTMLNLAEVSVSVMKRTVEFKNGNIILNVENSPLAKGNTVYDLLTRTPGVSIDDDQISLQGKNGVIVMIDDRPQLISNSQLIILLKGMSAESIHKIEVLKNPPVKYDASGSSGMINIRTKKAQLYGFSGNATSSYSQGNYAQSQNGISLNYKTEKLTFYSALNYLYNVQQDLSRLDRNIGSLSGNTLINNHTTNLTTGSDLDYKAGLDWNVNKKNTLGILMTGDPGHSLLNAIGTNSIENYNNLGFDRMNSDNQLTDQWNLSTYSLKAEHLFDTLRTTLSFTTDYTNLNEPKVGDFGNYFFNNSSSPSLLPDVYRSSIYSNTDIYTSRLDFNKTLNEKTTLETGMKYSLVEAGNNCLFENRNDSTGAYYKDNTLSNTYTYKENTLAAYFNFSRSLKKLNYQLGLRAENTDLNGSSNNASYMISKNYFNLFPNITMDYAPSGNNSFQLNLNRRIDRPNYDQMNPFRNSQDRFVYFVGNPFLLPQYTDNIELTWSYKKNIVNSLSLHYTENTIQDYTTQNDTSKVMIEMIKNMQNSEAITYSFFLQQTLKPGWELSANALISYLDYTGDISGVPYHTGSLFYTAFATTSIMLPAKVKMEITALYRGPRLNGVLIVAQREMLSMAWKKDFLDKKLSCSIGLNDIFYSMVYHTSVNFSNQNWNYYVSNDTRRAVVSISYNFGKMKVRTPEQVSSDTQEKDRLKH